MVYSSIVDPIFQYSSFVGSQKYRRMIKDLYFISGARHIWFNLRMGDHQWFIVYSSIFYSRLQYLVSVNSQKYISVIKDFNFVSGL
jgi:hypothetical protein